MVVYKCVCVKERKRKKREREKKKREREREHPPTTRTQKDDPYDLKLNYCDHFLHEQN